MHPDTVRYPPDPINKKNRRGTSIRLSNQFPGKNSEQLKMARRLAPVRLLCQDFRLELLEAYLIDELAQTLLLGMILVVVDYPVDEH
jgi:hypothetical protein